jgi:hypothetical protein
MMNSGLPGFTNLASPMAMLALVALAGSTRAQELPPAAAAQAPRQVVIYRCTDAAGRVTIQNDVACPKGTKQQRQAIDVPPPVPAYVPREERMPAVVAAERADEAADIAAEARAAASASATGSADDSNPDAAAGTSVEAPAIVDVPTAPAENAGVALALSGPPPALYACRTWDERDFLTEDATPAERCAPLQVVAADGSTRGDAAACEKVKDQCEAVPADALCAAWQRRVDEAEFRWKFAGAKQDDDRRREYELLKAKLAQSDCAGTQNP